MRGRSGARRLTDIFAGQGADSEALAEIYDLEHDDRADDLVFYREFARRSSGAILDLGTGSGRLLHALVAGSEHRVLGVDPSPALLARARRRIAAHPVLGAAARAGRLKVALGDAERIARSEQFGLVVACDVIPHLSGAEAAEQMLRSIARHVTPAGRVVLDLAGPAAIPHHDLGRDLDWERRVDGTRYRRWSELRRETADGVVVMLSTITERESADGTIARLPAAFRLWYPDRGLLERVIARAGLVVSALYGSHELDDFGPRSERLIAVSERPGRHRIG
ncbi:MAG: class I SAM-dependent methyltransferase [Chloroflexota bacterium]|nr:class I SAM-dependent methyltransferase [Chloroflexota bacterium]